MILEHFQRDEEDYKVLMIWVYKRDTHKVRYANGL